MERTELAWAAGFWDGEGSAYLTGATERLTRQPQARVNQAGPKGVPEVLVRFQRALGFGAIQGPDLVEGREPLYRWVVSSRREVTLLFERLAPWLGPVKRKQFAGVLGCGPHDMPADLAGEEARAWAAGLFDGEGSVYLAKHRSHRGYFRLEAAITQSDPVATPDVLTQFRTVTGLGFVKGPYPAPVGHYPVYRWKLYRAPDIERLIELLRPWLGVVKRAQADSAAAVVRAQPALPRGNPAWGNRKTHCVNGHEYASARMRAYRPRSARGRQSRASKQCLACLREYARSRGKRKSDGNEPSLL